jgi:hypothetical protein
MEFINYLLYILSVLEADEYEKFKSNYNLKSEQEVFAFILTSNDLDEVINEVELNSPSLNTLEYEQN